ncbi:MAG: YdcF family protein [Cyanobacteria bacterium CRU_2_1]|nr:YdcF family protein [Cyanobacteria bacterium RU_5_0]NJR62771.1 YdcF family protein [Cyanobacteria bacterium CRU_2_1]
MFELITQIIILVVVFFLLRFLFRSFIDQKYLTWIGVIVLLLILALAFLEPTNRTAGILWSIISFPLRPLGLSLILLGYAVRFGVKKVEGPQVMAAFLILLICSIPLTAYFLTAQTEQRTALDVSQRPTTRDVAAIVVMGDGALPTDPTYRLRTQLSNPLNSISVSLQSRLLYAAQLYGSQVRQGVPPLVIVSAGPQALLGDPDITAEEAVTTFLSQNGVPSEQVRVDTRANDLRSTAVEVRRILLGGSAEDCRVLEICDDGDLRELQTEARQLPEISAILVVPALQTRRAVSTFTKLDYYIIPRPTDFYVFQIQGGLRPAALTDLVPSAEALVITSRVVDEYLSSIYYFVRGWLSDPLLGD